MSAPFSTHPRLALTFSLLLLLSITMLSLSLGEVSLSPVRLLEVLHAGEGMEHTILMKIRLPRILMSIAVGGSLSLCGVILQGIYRNPLVEPYTLGLSGGASLGVSLSILLGWVSLGMWVMPVVGFAGAFLTIVLVYTLSFRGGRTDVHRMLLIGVMISFICSSLVLFVMAVASTQDLPSIIYWTMGSLTRPGDALLYGVAILSLVVLALSMLFALPLNALSIDEPLARHLGVNTHATIRILFLLTSVLIGGCIALSGVIGFVGLIVPHMCRQLAGNDHRLLLPLSYLNGAIFLLLCDLLARLLLSPAELPVGVITGILGGSAFLVLLYMRTTSASDKLS